MKKIFATIIALAALVSCNTEAVDEVVSTPQYLTTSLEVDLDGDTRVFDNNLVWSWESTDEIAAYQVAGDQIVNTLTHKDNGSFGTDDFKYSVTEPADFMFVYPAAALNDDKTLGYVQTGKWTPTLVGTVASTTVKDVNAQTITMAHYSAALEIRVFYSDGETSCKIKSATISTTTNGGVSASLANIKESSVVFNVASGDYIYDITLVDMTGRELVIPDRTISFVRGKRTILNVQWTPTIDFEVSSWWDNPANCPKGNTIYFTTLNCDATGYEVLVDGNTVEVTDNKITDVASGMHSVKIRVPKKAGGYYSVEKTVVVTSIPTLSSYSIYSSYDSFSFDNSENKEEYKVNKDNSKDGSSLYCTAYLSDTYIQNNTDTETVLVYNDATASLSLGTTKQLSGLTLGQYNTYVKCTLANGYELTGTASNIHVTGVPHRGTPTEAGGWAWYPRSGASVKNVQWNGDYVQLGGKTGYSRIKLDLYAPADFGVKVDVSGYIHANQIGIWYNTTFKVYVSDLEKEVASVGSNKQKEHPMSVSTTGTLTTSNPTVACLSSYEVSGPYTKVTNFDITY
ncbi:MAG: hypothetical protein J6J22_08365 [Alistipes sp.]|nr:hypothetical protein [Alistipes sp.]